ncbi:MAG: hypothetical protein QOH63_1985 [Acidobacteriota bacterium]|jgi:hypothetical protein|nr:hypothetical protein [Acidobacteriota bacterium]
MAIIGITRTLPVNVLKLVKEDMASALQEANGGQAMPPFIEFNLARPKEPHWPFITCYRRRTSKIEQIFDQSVGEPKTFSAEFAIEIGSSADTEDGVREENEVRQDAVDTILLSTIEDSPGALLEGFDDEIKGLLSFNISEWVNGNNVHNGGKHYIVGAGTLIVSF